MTRTELIRKWGRLAETSHSQAENTALAPLAYRSDLRYYRALEEMCRQILVDLSSMEPE